MTDAEALSLLDDYYKAQSNVALQMLFAMMYFDEREEQAAWLKLFYWCEAKDERSRVWGKFKSEFPRATMLKEGYAV